MNHKQKVALLLLLMTLRNKRRQRLKILRKRRHELLNKFKENDAKRRRIDSNDQAFDNINDSDSDEDSSSSESSDFDTTSDSSSSSEPSSSDSPSLDSSGSDLISADNSDQSDFDEDISIKDEPIFEDHISADDELQIKTEFIEPEECLDIKPDTEILDQQIKFENIESIIPIQNDLNVVVKEEPEIVSQKLGSIG